MQLGMIGLGRMGANMVRRIMHAGHECVTYDRSAKAVEGLAGEGATGANSLQELVTKMQAPRSVWLMLPAGVVDSTLDELAPLLERGDTVVDGGNSYYHDDLRRGKELAKSGIHYVDVGMSGGVWGLERGYCLMIGGEDEPVARLDPVFQALAPGRDAAPPTPGRTGREHGGGGLPPLRPGRRGALREDGPQRHRVRPHGGLRRGPEHPPPRRRRPAHGGDRRRDHAAAPPRPLPLRAQPGRRDRGLAARAA